MPFKMPGSPFHEMESNAQQRKNLMQDMPIDKDAESPLEKSTRGTMRKDNRKERKEQRDDGVNKKQRQEMRDKTLAKRQKEGSTEIDSGSDVGNFLRRVKYNFKKEADAKRGIQSSGGRDGDININTVAETSDVEKTDLVSNTHGSKPPEDKNSKKGKEPGSDAAYQDLMSF